MRILVVEDHKDTANSIKERLEAECYAVDVEHDGTKGFYRACTNKYDLIVLDNILPGKEGPEICQALRERNIVTPVIILSVRGETDQKVNLLNCGADDYLAKPFSFAELSARVRALLRRPHQTETSLLSVNDLVLDRNTFTASRGKNRAYLTIKEFALLEYLMKNRDKVVSRGMILEHVWDNAGDPFSNSIETHIMNLRKKIDANPRKRLIHTVPGRGYKLSSRS
jgi:two-component system, OmpR family, response regulator